MPTTADLVSGPSGVGLGAVVFNGVDDVVALPNADKYRLQTFTLEAEFHGDVDGPIFAFPDFACVVRHFTGGVLQVTFNFTTGPVLAVVCPGGTFLPGWNRVTIVRAGPTDGGYVQVWRGPTLVASAVEPRTLAYTSDASSFATVGAVGVDFAVGRIGFVRVSSTARDARSIARGYYLMRRNPVEFAREFFAVELGEQVGASFDEWAALVDAIGDNGLRLDGAVTDEVTVENVLAQVVPFLDFKFYRNVDGAWEIQGARAATEVAGTLDDGGPNDNFRFADCTPASLAEAVQTLPVHYRVMRDERGTFKDYTFKEMQRPVLDVGSEGQPLQLALVHDHETADRIGCRRAKRMRTRDQGVTGTAGHEGRGFVPGAIVDLTVASEGIAGRHEVLGAVNQVRESDLALAPYDEEDLVYDPGPLPENEPVIDTSAAITLGSNPHLELSGGGLDPQDGTTKQPVRIDVRLGRSAGLGLVGDGDPPQDAAKTTFDHGVGVADPTIGGLAAYLAVRDGKFIYSDHAGDKPAQHWTKFRPPVLADGAQPGGLRVVIAVLSIYPATATLRLRTYWSTLDQTNEFAVRQFTVPPGATYQTFTAQIDVNPVTLLPWTIVEITDLQVGVEITAPPTAAVTLPQLLVAPRLTQVGIGFEEANVAPADFSLCRVWRKGPIDAQPADPAESEQPIFATPALVGFQDGYFPDGGGRYWYWARVYDSIGRGSALIGPASITRV